MREILEAKVNEILDAIGGDFTNNQLSCIADHLATLVELACVSADRPVTVETVASALSDALDPVLEMTLRVSTMLDALQKAAKQA